MKIEAPEENKIIIELSDEDMHELDITYDRMDYSNIETRRVIWTLLDRARQSLGRDIDPSGRMLIEALPNPVGGCIIYFTVLDDDIRTANKRNVFQIRKESTAATYEFDSLDSLTACACALRLSQKTLPQSSLFALDGRYRLALSECSHLRETKNLCSEFGFFCGSSHLTVEYLREHWNTLAESDAVQKLTI